GEYRNSPGEAARSMTPAGEEGATCHRTPGCATSERRFGMNTISNAPAPAGEVDVDRPYELDPATPARFERDGFVRLPGVLTPATIAHFEPEITAKLI